MKNSWRRWGGNPGLRHGFRSGLEEKIGDQIKAAGLPVVFEQWRVAYTVPERAARYTPDFVLPNGIIIETKGRFTTEDRQKMRLIKLQHPELDIRFVFSNANARIAKQSKTTLAKWAETYGFPWAHKAIPQEWLTEQPQAGKLETLKNLIPAKPGGKVPTL